MMHTMNNNSVSKFFFIITKVIKYANRKGAFMDHKGVINDLNKVIHFSSTLLEPLLF